MPSNKNGFEQELPTQTEGTKTVPSIPVSDSGINSNPLVGNAKSKEDNEQMKLISENEQLNAKLNEFRTKVKNQNAVLLELRTLVGGKNNRHSIVVLNSIVKKVETLEKDLTAKYDEILKLTASVTEASNTIKEKEEEITKLKISESNYIASENDYIKMISKLETQISSLTIKKDEEISTLTDAVQKLNEELASLDAVKEKLSISEEMVNKLKSELGSKEEQLVTISSSQSDSLTAEFEVKQQELISSYEEKVQIALEKRDKTIDRYREREEELQKIEQAHKSEIRQMSERYKTLITKLHGVEAELAEVRGVGQGYLTENERLVEANRTLSEQLAEVQKVEQERVKELEQLTETNQTLSEQLEEAKSALAKELESKAEIEEIHNEAIEELKNSFDLKESSIDFEYKEEISKLTKENEELCEQYEQSIEAINEKNAELDKLVGTVNSLTESNGQLTAQIANHSQSLNDAEAKLLSLTDELLSKDKEIAQTLETAQNAVSSNEVDSLKAKVTDLEEKLFQSQNKIIEITRTADENLSKAEKQFEFTQQLREELKVAKEIRNVLSKEIELKLRKFIARSLVTERLTEQSLKIMNTYPEIRKAYDAFVTENKEDFRKILTQQFDVVKFIENRKL